MYGNKYFLTLGILLCLDALIKVRKEAWFQCLSSGSGLGWKEIWLGLRSVESK